jgi:hypothetical protein
MTARELDAAGGRKEALFLKTFSGSPFWKPIFSTKRGAEFVKHFLERARELGLRLLMLV